VNARQKPGVRAAARKYKSILAARGLILKLGNGALFAFV
jgi:hypothetical protein